MTTNETNFVALPPPPTGQFTWFPTPRVKTFTDEDPLVIEAGVNAWLDTLATPVLPDVNYTIVSIDYAGADLQPTKMRFSALVYYTLWEHI